MPHFQRRHYVPIAALIRGATESGLIQRTQAITLVSLFNHLFRGDNPRFQPQRFVNAAIAPLPPEPVGPKPEFSLEEIEAAQSEIKSLQGK